jgi:signal transduction histidine kinase
MPGGVALYVPTPGGCIEAVANREWWEGLLEVGPELELITSEVARDDRPPTVALPVPFDDRAVSPRESAWQSLLDGYRSRIKMIVSEGAFFAMLLFVLIGMLVRTLRREAELERQHRNFLSAITHDLKSPLASMRLALETVLSGRADGDAGRRFLDNALRDTERLQNLVQKVLEVTRYDRGGGRLEFRRASLSGVVADAVDGFSRHAEQLGIRIDADLTEDVWSEFNEEGIGVVVSNLLENAAKYGGGDPRIEVRMSLKDGHAVLDVRDHGAGIPTDEVPYIFDRFYRGGDEMTRTTNGTGLGLYLVKQIVAAHRGTVVVASTGPDGTTFRVTLPGAQLKEARP